MMASVARLQCSTPASVLQFELILDDFFWRCDYERWARGGRGWITVRNGCSTEWVEIPAISFHVMSLVHTSFPLSCSSLDR